MGTPTIVNMHEAKTKLSELGRRVWEGEEIVIARAGEPYLDLVPHRSTRQDRTPGRWAGRLWIAEDFDETDAETIAAFEGAQQEESG
ncbi:MAG: type II toxin-antitoxin system prevent-host-death family antitoxin [Thermodesulfobacteriota bacterium]